MTKLAAFVIVVLAAATTLLSFFGDNSYPRLSYLKSGLQKQTEKNVELRENVNSLRREVYGLQSDKRALEKAARNELGMARPDEMIFIFDKEKDKDSSEKGGANP